jgi:hypothetical protein
LSITHRIHETRLRPGINLLGRRWILSRRVSPPLLLLQMLHIARVPQRHKQHERREAHGNSSATRKYPAEALDFAARIGVERDCDFVVEFLDLLSD